MAEIVLRKATLDDVPAILALYREAGIESGEAFSQEQAARHFGVFSQYPNYRVFVAEIEPGIGGDTDARTHSEIAGTYELLIMDNLAKGGRRSGIVEDVAVKPSRQGCGIGRSMMEHALERCREAGCYKLVLSSGTQRTSAHDFYDATGFERHGVSFRITID